MNYNNWAEKLGFSLTGQTGDEESYTDAGSSAFNLRHDFFYSVEIWTGANKTGTQLVLNTDYSMVAGTGDLADSLNAKSGIAGAVQTQITILNVTYQTGDIYITPLVSADIVDNTDINLAVLKYDSASNLTTNNPTLEKGETAIESESLSEKIGDGSTPWTTLNYKNGNYGQLAQWNSATNYTSEGEISNLVLYNGSQYMNILDIGNQGNNPLKSPKKWLRIPSKESLLENYSNGDPLSGGVNPVSDRAGSQYLQNLSYGKYVVDGNLCEFYRIHLDGSTVTGDPTLEDIFNIGESDEYFNLDIFAPDSGGTRTLIDTGDHVTTPQSSGGDADTVGELVEDQFQGHKAENFVYPDGGISSSGLAKEQTLRAGGISVKLELVSDGVNGTPRTGSTTHGKRLTVGSSYIIVMKVL